MQVKKLSSHQPANLFEIRKPVWGGRKVGLAEYKIGNHNEIRILYTDTAGRPIYPQPFYISGERAKKYPKQPVRNHPNIVLHVIPINELDILERF